VTLEDVDAGARGGAPQRDLECASTGRDVRGNGRDGAGDVLEITEIGAQGPRRVMRAPFQYAAALSGGPEMPVRSEGLRVVAVVDVTYGLTPG